MSMEELLPAFVAGELNEEDRERVLRALSESPQLWDEVRRYQQLYFLLAAAAAIELEAPSDMATQIARQMTRHYLLQFAARLAGDVFGTYGRAFVFYLGLR